MTLICFSHLRWNFVFQRPQHLLSRFAKNHAVYFIEEPIFGAALPELRLRWEEPGVYVAVPHLPGGRSEQDVWNMLKSLVDDLIADKKLKDLLLWYYTPMALPFSRHLGATATVYDCMDELSLFKNPHPLLTTLEAELFERADVVFTGGHSLYEHKRFMHPNVHAMPSSIDFRHFSAARKKPAEPEDQKSAGPVRLGFAGVIDERFDIELVEQVAGLKPDWNLIMIGPVVKISEDALPRRPNIHYLGMKNYKDLPAYMAHWTIGILPFARNDSTRFISPTKTPEYLAAGLPVISTSIADVVRPYGEQGLVSIADEAGAFIRAGEKILQTLPNAEWRARVDAFLSQTSWDGTQAQMAKLVQDAIAKKSSQREDSEDDAAAAGGEWQIPAVAVTSHPAYV
ncbi:MAG TPA: glycosyltransferase [Bdellovibrionales bacterium]|nr:glycosyltransferase [Bdellovibrionales bacterium]